MLFADEPTGNLDSRSSAEVIDLLREASGVYGQTIVMVTHDPPGGRRPRSSPTAVSDMRARGWSSTVKEIS